MIPTVCKSYKKRKGVGVRWFNFLLALHEIIGKKNLNVANLLILKKYRQYPPVKKKDRAFCLCSNLENKKVKKQKCVKTEVWLLLIEYSKKTRKASVFFENLVVLV